MKPVIGVCAAFEQAAWSFWRQEAAVVAGSYLDAVRRAAGLPMILAPQELGSGDAAALMDHLDGLLLIGGADIDPSLYGEVRSGRTEATFPLRDRFELALVSQSLARDTPVLGICRGLQILNVATGGTLHGHLADCDFGEHRPAPGRLDAPTFHEIEVEAGGLLAASTGAGRHTVNSHHHQGVARVGGEGRVAARSVPDGLVEAVEWPAHHHALGVQWHPEAIELDATVGAFVAAAIAARDGSRSVGSVS